MKYTFATIAAFASMALAQPAFLNTQFDLSEGKPYTIRFSGCDSGCTIVLQNGESTDLKDYKTLTSGAKGDSFTFTPSQLPSDTYNFKITDSAGEVNYSEQFTYEGSYDAPSVTSATKSAVETTAAQTTTLASVTKPVEETTTVAKPIIPTHVPANNATTPVATPTKTGGAGETGTGVPEVPVSGATRMTSSLALIAGAAMAMVYLN
ncbi:hypothetical protein FLAG1_06104 [Fusarium langsethiae]|uniref:Yeast cell wall synthesis Kre9/Knh1-like N-terminal domain-containing protein n=1 Tax=Fusarium langsethiae TaxID=179993 RepID=A0A0M9EVY8_FUSLA|nr:hypothetical protein FLAG1_06104 [Fusarium langsethiae]GKT98705.1 unnamed protein product [Fusarium langsethiae]GKU18018.1 unnamed protein product [Fusarium langsethiae]